MPHSSSRLLALPRTLLRDPLLAFLGVLSVALLVLFLLLLGSTRPISRGTEVPLSQVQNLEKRNQITTLTVLDYDHRVLVTTRDGQRLWSSVPSNGATTDLLVRDASTGNRPAEVTVNAQEGKQMRRLVVQVLLPILILVAWFSFFARLGQVSESGGVGAFSRWKGRQVERGGDQGPRFPDVAGAGTAVGELQELCDLLRDPNRYVALGARPPKGSLLVGPPGTGKTLLARATANEAGAAFFAVSGSEFVESLVGVGAARIRDLFRVARSHAPAIIFIDELDAVGRRRGAGVGQGNDEREQTLNQLLVEMDGFDAGAGLIVLAATNRPDVLDPALLRSGRFDRQINVEAPDMQGRAAILELYLKGRPCDMDVEPRLIAQRCPGFTGAELENVVNEAALLAARSGAAAISASDLIEGIDRTAAGARELAHVLTERERNTIAVHEAAHAVVAAASGRSEMVHAVSIIARGRRLGRATSLLLDRDRTVLRRSDLERQLTVTLAGAAAEQEAFNEMSTAVHEDLHSATQLARSMVTSFGMSNLGPVTIGERSAEVFLGAALQELSSVGTTTLDAIDAETRRLVEDASERATLILRQHWGTVEMLARQLVERESLADAELAELLAPCAPAAADDPGSV